MKTVLIFNADVSDVSGGMDSNDSFSSSLNMVIEPGQVKTNLSLKLRCDSRFQRAFTACGCDFKVITLV